MSAIAVAPPVACGGLEPVAVADDRQHGGVVETGLVGAAGVDPPQSPYFLILSENRNARVARNAQKPRSRYKTGTVTLVN